MVCVSTERHLRSSIPSHRERNDGVKGTPRCTLNGIPSLGALEMGLRLYCERDRRGNSRRITGVCQAFAWRNGRSGAGRCMVRHTEDRDKDGQIRGRGSLLGVSSVDEQTWA